LTAVVVRPRPYPIYGIDMPHNTGALLDPATAGASIEGYKGFLLTVATGDQANEARILEGVVAHGYACARSSQWIP